MCDLDNEIKELKKALAELEAKAKKAEAWPQEGDTVYILWTGGDVSVAGYHINYRNYLAAGNLFATQAEAELEVKRRALGAKIKPYTFKPNWNTNQLKYYIYLNAYTHSPVATSYVGYDLMPRFGYFKTADIAKEVIDKFGTEILELFGDNT